MYKVLFPESFFPHFSVAVLNLVPICFTQKTQGCHSSYGDRTVNIFYIRQLSFAIEQTDTSLLYEHTYIFQFSLSVIAAKKEAESVVIK